MAGTIHFILGTEDAQAIIDATCDEDAIAVVHPLNAQGKPNGLTLIAGHGGCDGRVTNALLGHVHSTYGAGEIPDNVKVICCHSSIAKQHYGSLPHRSFQNLSKALIGNWAGATRVQCHFRTPGTYTLVVSQA